MPGRRRSSARKSSGGHTGRRRSTKPSGGGRDEIIPCAYFNEVFVECRAELTSKLSKPNGEEVRFMEAFHNANVDSIPEHLKADYSEVQYQERFSKAKTEPVTIFVSKVMQEATDVMAESRFKKVQE